MTKAKTKTKEDCAREFAGNHCKFHCYSSHDTFRGYEHPEYFGIYYFHTNGNNGATCLSKSNQACIEKALKKFMSGKKPSVIEICDSHYVVGLMDGIAVKVYKDDGKSYTKAFEVFYGLMKQLEEYGILDEDDFSNREYKEGQERLHGEMLFAIRSQNDFDQEKVLKVLIADVCHEFMRVYEPANHDLADEFPYDLLEKFVQKKFKKCKQRVDSNREIEP